MLQFQWEIEGIPHIIASDVKLLSTALLQYEELKVQAHFDMAGLKRMECVPLQIELLDSKTAQHVQGIEITASIQDENLGAVNSQKLSIRLQNENRLFLVPNFFKLAYATKGMFILHCQVKVYYAAIIPPSIALDKCAYIVTRTEIMEPEIEFSDLHEIAHSSNVHTFSMAQGKLKVSFHRDQEVFVMGERLHIQLQQDEPSLICVRGKYRFSLKSEEKLVANLNGEIESCVTPNTLSHPIKIPIPASFQIQSVFEQQMVSTATPILQIINISNVYHRALRVEPWAMDFGNMLDDML